MPFVRLDDIKIHYETEGIGRPLILLHSGLGCARDIMKTHKRFAERFKIIAPDRTGYGMSTKIEKFPEDFFKHQAEETAPFLEALGITKAHIYGVSDGAVIAVHVALNQPKLVRSLVLESGHFSLSRRGGYIALFEKLRDPEKLESGWKEALLRAHGDEYWKRLVSNWREIWLKILRTKGDLYSGRLQELKCPTLVIHGAKDQFATTEEIQEMHRLIPSSELHILRETGHPIFGGKNLELESLCHRIVLDFLEKL
nr:alpha/beta hydrolase [Candidatus Njordarchaeum guaymaensis]